MGDEGVYIEEVVWGRGDVGGIGDGGGRLGDRGCKIKGGGE